MTELLAPAGNMEALKAAIANGCDAIYLGLQKFGARAYSDNFSADTLKEAVDYAHLRDVKIYVTMNTIVFEDEISDMQEQLRQLNEICVDGIIVQDLAVFDYAEKHFADMEVHCSTQMGIDDLEGRCFSKSLAPTESCWRVKSISTRRKLYERRQKYRLRSSCTARFAYRTPETASCPG